MIYQLRPYQRDAVDALWRSLSVWKRPLIVAPTGSGKSIILAQICREWLMGDPNVGILVATHVKELVEQNAEKLVSLIGHDAVGVHSAGLARRDVEQRVIIGGVQSLINRVEELGPRHVVIVDEAHRIPRDGNGQYMQLLAALNGGHGAEYLIGLTATPYRMDSGELHKGEGALFEGIAYDIKIKGLVEAGHLVRPRPFKTAAKFAIDGARIERGDFVLDELRETLEDPSILGNVVQEWLDKAVAHGRKATLTFCATVAQAGTMLALVRETGHTAELITGETPKDRRAEILARFKRGELEMLINVMVLTTGFDAPNVDCMLVLRPTASTGLYVQIYGRGMRPAPGKQDCLVLDYGANVERHGPIDQVTVNTKKSGSDPLAERGPMAKFCDACGAENAIAARTCSECGWEFPIKIARKATPMEMLAMGEPVELDVISTTAARHVSGAGNVCVRLDYWATPDHKDQTEQSKVYCEFFSVAHPFALGKLQKRLAITDDESISYGEWVDVAKLALSRRQPKTITVQRDGKYHKVLACALEPIEPMLAEDGYELDEVPF